MGRGREKITEEKGKEEALERKADGRKKKKKGEQAREGEGGKRDTCLFSGLQKHCR